MNLWHSNQAGDCLSLVNAVQLGYADTDTVSAKFPCGQARQPLQHCGWACPKPDSTLQPDNYDHHLHDTHIFSHWHPSCNLHNFFLLKSHLIALACLFAVCLKHSGMYSQTSILLQSFLKTIALKAQHSVITTSNQFVFFTSVSYHHHHQNQ